MAEVVERFRLFPLGIVLLPRELVPLHIFEERYKTMVGECIAGDHGLGIVWLADDGLREVGCAARIERVLDRMPDGRMNVAVRGTRALRLLRRIVDMPYPAGDVELLDDAPARDDELAEAAALARERYAALVERATGEPPQPGAVDALGAYDIAARVELPLAVRQALLELRSEAERLRRLAGELEEAMRRLAIQERASERARSNGRVRRGG